MAIEIVDKKIIVWENAAVVQAEPREQFGQTYLAGRCPACHMGANLSGEGRHVCVNCNKCLIFKDATKQTE